MNNGLAIWIEGWKVIWRLLVFKLTFLLIASPLYLLHVIITSALKSDGNSIGIRVYAFYAIAGWLILAPFIYCIASRLRGEFIYPRYKAKETAPDINKPTGWKQVSEAGVSPIITSRCQSRCQSYYYIILPLFPRPKKGISEHIRTYISMMEHVAFRRGSRRKNRAYESQLAALAVRSRATRSGGEGRDIKRRGAVARLLLYNVLKCAVYSVSSWWVFVTRDF